MKFVNWKIDDLIEYLDRMESAPKDRLDYHCVPRVSGNITVQNGEPANNIYLPRRSLGELDE